MVTDSEKLLLACYRIDEALRHLGYCPEPTFFQRLFRRRPKLGIGWASADLALSKAKAALGMKLGPDDVLMGQKPHVKEIEARLYQERKGTSDGHANG